MPGETLKLEIEVFKLIILTMAIIVVARYRKLFETSLSPSLIRKGTYFATLLWLGFLADVMNDVYPTELTKSLDDIIISLALLLGTYYLLDHMMRVRVKIEPSKALKGTPLLQDGAYLLSNPDVERAMHLSSGKKVIALTRNPEPFRKRGLPYLWLTKVPGENAIDPLRLPAILHKLIENADRETVVIIDGLEYLILENGFESVLKFLTTLKDSLLLKGATLLLVLDPNTLEPHQAALLKKEFKSIEQ
ncbi:MAG: hypothetical protein PWQ79_2296 [Thermococcaceae archaeon]|nr:hypothetical protein [Thermococcaceae archaeon]MDK2915381.1 hypothetical protein [Thermococcaceae archaeon]